MVQLKNAYTLNEVCFSQNFATGKYFKLKNGLQFPAATYELRPAKKQPSRKTFCVRKIVHNATGSTTAMHNRTTQL